MRASLIVLAFCVQAAMAAEPIAFADTHAHLDHQGEPGRLAQALDNALVDMDRSGVRLTFLMPPPQVSGMRFLYDLEALRISDPKYAKRFAVIAGGGSLNPMIQDIAPDRVGDEDRRRFRAKADELLASGVKAFGEIAVHHVSHARMGSQHPYESVPADHPLLLLLADIAAERGIPIDIHLDIVPEDMDRPPGPFNAATPGRLRANLPAFERLLAHNRKASIIWAHAGTDPLRQRTPELQRALMQRHANLYSSLRIGLGGAHPTAMTAEDGSLREPWRQLLLDFPERFVIGSDSFHPVFANSRRTPVEALDRSRMVLGQLPSAVSRAIAWDNVVRLFGLKEDVAPAIEAAR